MRRKASGPVTFGPGHRDLQRALRELGGGRRAEGEPPALPGEADGGQRRRPHLDRDQGEGRLEERAREPAAGPPQRAG